jgi:hypothetical protein
MSVRKVKRDGEYPPLREGNILTSYTLKLLTKSLRLVVYETSTSFLLYIGGHEIYCINVQIFKESSGYDISEGNLIKIRYDTVCSLENNFVRGIDTTMILRVMCDYISKNYSYVKVLRFTDQSTRACNNGSTVNLYEMSFLTTGHTWYEKHFGAYLTKKSQSSFDDAVRRFQELKKNTRWVLVRDTITSELPLPESTLEDMYTKADTWQDFFSPLSIQMGIPKFCEFVSPWLDIFIKSHLHLQFMGLTYLLPITPMNTPYTITTYQRGGKRLTRKAMKEGNKDWK